MYNTTVNYFSTSAFDYLEQKADLIKIALLFMLLNGKKGINLIFQCYQLSFLQSMLKTSTLSNSELLQKCSAKCRMLQSKVWSLLSGLWELEQSPCSCHAAWSVLVLWAAAVQESCYIQDRLRHKQRERKRENEKAFFTDPASSRP